ncbi:hypothetical protein GKZ28_27520 [Clostridium chromiireducens]|uniref:Uncharacterized protein n=1 Tax=Clostridium chromiireducens TaxID=225345 RepID=A0A964W5A5_9CLOT|nr:hypothetical protein [Clostridium chromiireducens]MVX67371.1 hypothetical protein [Clostridium chromiireducens]
MRTIKTLRDIELLKEASAVRGDILQQMEEHFKHIYKNIGEEDGIAVEEFFLVDSGIIVLLEAGDNVADLAEIGLNPKDNGLLGATPEWINEQKLENCTLITVCVLCNNEYALSIFLERGKFGQEVENWISENM